VSIIHSPEWIEPHTHLFVASGDDQNIVAVDREFSQLDKHMKDLLNNPAKAKKISENSAKTFRDRYLTPAAQACYWRKMIQSWSKVSFEPQLFHEVKGNDGKRRKEIRGTSFETFVSDLVMRES
jgi:hypothetical protein